MSWLFNYRGSVSKVILPYLMHIYTCARTYNNNWLDAISFDESANLNVLEWLILKEVERLSVYVEIYMCMKDAVSVRYNGSKANLYSGRYTMKWMHRYWYWIMQALWWQWGWERNPYCLYELAILSRSITFICDFW